MKRYIFFMSNQILFLTNYIINTLCHSFCVFDKINRFLIGQEVCNYYLKVIITINKLFPPHLPFSQLFQFHNGIRYRSNLLILIACLIIRHFRDLWLSVIHKNPGCDEGRKIKVALNLIEHKINHKKREIFKLHIFQSSKFEHIFLKKFVSLSQLANDFP